MIKRKLIKAIKGLDMFGIPVSLTYKNENKIKSFAGGMMTLAARVFIFVYLFSQMLKVF